MGGEAHKRGLAGAVEGVVDVHRLAVRGAEVAELLHLFQKLHDAAGFLDDEVRQFLIFRRQVHAEKLGRAGNPGERVLDLMRQHLGHADGRAGGSLRPHRPAQTVGQFAGGQDQHHDVGVVVHRREVDGALQGRAVAGRHVHVVDVQGRLVGADAGERLFHRGLDGEAVEDGLASEGLLRGVEEGLCRRVGLQDRRVLVDEERREGK